MAEKILIIAGPTASGKSAFAMEAAKRFDGEIVSCDSMQIYRYMDIGTAKPTREEREEIPHHLVDFVDPREEFTVADYARLAREAIADIASRGKLPIICGGTGLYLNSILYKMDFGEGPKDEAYRRQLEELASREGAQALHEQLKSLDPEAAERIHPNNRKKLIRALERLRQGEGAVREFGKANQADPAFAPTLVGICRQRQELYDRINARVLTMIREGLADEVKKLSEMGLTAEHVSMQGIGYREMFPYLAGEKTLEETTELIQKNTRHYAKRQFTWFKRYDTMKWQNLSEFTSEEEAWKDLILWLEARK